MKTSETTLIKPVIIPREVADAIEKMRSGGFDNESVIYAVINPTRSYDDRLTHLRSIPFDTLLSALVNGYERELTEEEAREAAYESARQYYREQLAASFRGTADDHHNAPYAIIHFLTLADIVIDGVNNEGGAA